MKPSKETEQEVQNKLSIMFGVLTVLERHPLGYEMNVMDIREQVVAIRNEQLVRTYFVYAMGVLAQRGNIVACDRMGYWKAGSI
jgi:hypothetical protein